MRSACGNLAELDHVGIVEEFENMNMIISPKISPEALAHLGDGEIAYIRTIRSEDVPAMFPQAPEIAPGLQLFALLAADGTPIMVTDSREAAVANAWSNELQNSERALSAQSGDGMGDRPFPPPEGQPPSSGLFLG